MERAYNFSPGPGMLPDEVLDRVRDELLNWHGSGMSVMEMSHRGRQFLEIIGQTEADLREVLNIPASYRILFLQGGGNLQFAMVPLNLLRGRNAADYVNTGYWSNRAIEDARQFCSVNVAASSEDAGFTYAPTQAQWRTDPEAAYVHYVSNDTAAGVEFHWVPATGQVPLVADMSTNILSRPIDVNRHGLIYACAQKNLGIAGLTIVIIREDLVGGALPITPGMLDYGKHVENGSMYNAMPYEGVRRLVEAMKEFEARDGGAAAILPLALMPRHTDGKGKLFLCSREPPSLEHSHSL
ncbi:MAG: 3-phosphoserine/phosphohydroxythreonine transaminase, partial [Betaproteobacteria bacterium]|nr:3-phosphoserine/phosphohydroxythreonine transaminase [Betaproteobacteria bacterium]